MKQVIEFLPWMLFAITFWITKDMYWATVVLVVVVLVQSLYLYWTQKKLEPMQLATLVLVVVFGGLTIFLRNNAFIQWKPTVINALFAAIFLGSHCIGNKPLVERILGKQISLPSMVWRNLSIMWIIFFLFSSGVNAYVLMHYSENFWVNFKLFGQMGILLCFLIIQTVYIFKYLPKEAQGRPMQVNPEQKTGVNKGSSD